MFSRESTLKRARDQLGKFAQHPDANSLLPKVLNELNRFETLSSDQITLDEVNTLRKLINGWLKNNTEVATTTIDNIKLEDALYSALVAIAAAKPLNKDDPMTLETVNEEDRIVTSDGFQFDATTLLGWINSKKKMQHPSYMADFGVYDQANIRAYANDKNITLDLSGHTEHEIEDPGLLLGALAAMGPDWVSGHAEHEIEDPGLLHEIEDPGLLLGAMAAMDLDRVGLAIDLIRSLHERLDGDLIHRDVREDNIVIEIELPSSPRFMPIDFGTHTPPQHEPDQSDDFQGDQTPPRRRP